jgi:hypothetical protein
MKNSSLWYKFDLGNERHFAGCVKKLEFLCRKSLAYDSWQKRTKYPVSVCPVCSDSFQWVKPETHHYPETMFDICEGVLQKHIDLNDLDDYTDFQICDEIMQAHFEKKVSYVVLCKSCHEKYHDNVPDVLDAMADAFNEQQKLITDFYTKDISKTKGEENGKEE